MLRSLISAAMITGFALSTTACAQDVDTADKAAIEKVVKDYLLENPEIIIEALNVLDERQQAEAAEAARKLIAANGDAIFNDPNDYSIGPENAEVTIVEFFDYRCGPCRGAAQWVNAAPAAYDGKVRVVFKEFPILSPESRQAALAALAAGEQGKYAEMHRALMQDRSSFNKSDIDRVANSIGLDIEKMREDMKSPALEKTLDDTRELAQKIGANSTPTFIIGDELFAGLDLERIERLISEAS